MFRRVANIFRESNAPAHASSLEKMIIKISDISGGLGTTYASPGWSTTYEIPGAEGVLFDIVGNETEFISDSVRIHFL